MNPAALRLMNTCTLPMEITKQGVRMKMRNVEQYFFSQEGTVTNPAI